MEECETDAEKLAATDGLKEYYKNLLDMLRKQFGVLDGSHKVFEMVQKEMIVNKAKVANMSGEAKTKIARKITEFESQKVEVEHMIESYNQKIQGYEDIALNLKDFEKPEASTNTFKCEDKNQKCVKLASSVSKTLEKSTSVGVGVKYKDFGLDVNYAGAKKSGDAQTDERLQCWRVDECTKIMANHYMEEKKNEHEMEKMYLKMREEKEKENRAERK